jgi:molybdopterin molybdotransferase
LTREFFAVRTVAEALADFRPGRRTAVERVGLAQARGRVPAAAVRAAGDLPGFARSTVDGYAVRAADTYGASDGLPAYLRVAGAVQMGATADVAVHPGSAVEIPTGGALPDGADAVVMVEHTQAGMPGTLEVTRPAAPGEGLVRADEDVAAGDLLVPAGRPLRPQDLGVLAAAGAVQVDVLARPRVGIVSSGDEVVAPAETPRPGQVRDATAHALAAIVTDAGGEPRLYGIAPDDPEALRGLLAAAVAECDLAVVSAGSSVGARDATAEVVAGLGPPGVFCHGLAIKPGKPTMLAMCGDVPVIGLPGNPLSALVVFRLVGVPVLRLVGGCAEPAPEPVVRATLSRDLRSATGRLDVVQVRLADGRADPLFAPSALISTLAAADGYVTVPEEASGLYAGTEVDVTLYR